MANLLAHIPMVLAAILAPWAIISTWIETRERWRAILWEFCDDVDQSARGIL